MQCAAFRHILHCSASGSVSLYAPLSLSRASEHQPNDRNPPLSLSRALSLPLALSLLHAPARGCRNNLDRLGYHTFIDGLLEEPETASCRCVRPSSPLPPPKHTGSRTFSGAQPSSSMRRRAAAKLTIHPPTHPVLTPPSCLLHLRRTCIASLNHPPSPVLSCPPPRRLPTTRRPLIRRRSETNCPPSTYHACLPSMSPTRSDTLLGTEFPHIWASYQSSGQPHLRARREFFLPPARVVSSGSLHLEPTLKVACC